MAGGRYPTKLPRSFGLLSQWIAELETDELGRLIPSFWYFKDYSESVRGLQSFSTSAYMHELVAPVRQRLENPLHMALARICSYSNSLPCKEQDGTTNPYSVLATALDRQVS